MKNPRNRLGNNVPLALTVCAAFGLVASARAADVSPSFTNDVMAVLSKAGCNAGACHGNKSGKGGFRLSLRGENPRDDFAALTRDLWGRRTNVLEPEGSLILQKATGALPHEGGVRFTSDSPEYVVLRAWIAGGAKRDDAGAVALARLEVTPAARVLVEPERETKIGVTAVFSDGSRRDVSRMA